jgi:hypothetical protein
MTVGGCGVKSAPISPEMARPEAIDNLTAVNQADGIRLTWERPTQYASGRTMRDLGMFILLRSVGGRTLEPLVELPVTDQERFRPEREFFYVDGETHPGERYTYEVISRTLDGYTSDPSNPAELKRERPKLPNPENFRLPHPTPLPTNIP